jgi:hypothetical protein
MLQHPHRYTVLQCCAVALCCTCPQVYSKSEVLEAQQQALALGPAGGEVDAWGNVVPASGEGGLAARGRRGKRTMAIGSQNAANLQQKGGRKGGVVSWVGYAGTTLHF